MKKAGILFLAVVLGCAQEIKAQGYAGEAATLEPTALIDKPTAGMLKRGNFFIGANFYQRGGVLTSVAVGLFDIFSFGISYGGTDIIGPNRIEMNPWPGVNAKLRVIQETALMPAIAVGFESQGKEPYLDSLSRYTIKSPGFYAVASKNYEFMGNLSLHGGLNYSMENKDGDKDMNMFVGAEKSLGEMVSLIGEFDFAFNDDNTRALGRGRGYFNFGIRLSAGDGLMIGFDLKNVTKNQQNVQVGNRVLQIEYVGHF